MPYPEFGLIPPTINGPSPALDALRKLGSVSPQHGMAINKYRLTEAKEPIPLGSYPPSTTPPAEQPGMEQILESLRLAYGWPPSPNQIAPSTILRGPKLDG